jgi:hypothetical protein
MRRAAEPGTHLLTVVAAIPGAAVLGESVSGLAPAGLALILARMALTRKSGRKP